MDLSITVNGMKFPTRLSWARARRERTHACSQSYDAGWGGAVAKTVSLNRRRW